MKLSRQVDLGYVPYIHYLRQLGNKPVPFGTRDQPRVEFDVFVSAEIGTHDTAEAVGAMLAINARELSDRFLHDTFKDAFVEAARCTVFEKSQ